MASTADISGRIHWRTRADVEKRLQVPLLERWIIWQVERLADSDEHHYTAFATGFDNAVKIKLPCLQISGTSLIDRNGQQQLCERDESFTLRQLGCYWLMNRIRMTKLAVWILMQVRHKSPYYVHLNLIVSGVYFFWKSYGRLFFFMAPRPKAGHDLFILEVSGSNTTTHHIR